MGSGLRLTAWQGNGTDTRPLPWYEWVGRGTLFPGEVGLALGGFAVRVLFYCIARWPYIVLGVEEP